MSEQSWHQDGAGRRGLGGGHAPVGAHGGGAGAAAAAEFVGEGDRHVPDRGVRRFPWLVASQSSSQASVLGTRRLVFGAVELDWTPATTRSMPAMTSGHDDVVHQIKIKTRPTNGLGHRLGTELERVDGPWALSATS